MSGEPEQPSRPPTPTLPAPSRRPDIPLARYPWATRVETFWSDGVSDADRADFDTVPEDERAGYAWHPPFGDWGPGEWNDEPDLCAWSSPATPYPLMVIRGKAGAWCGYVGLPPEHPCARPRRRDAPLPSLSQDINWSEEGGFGPFEPGLWWLGFDCMHLRQLAPRLVACVRDTVERLRACRAPVFAGTPLTDSMASLLDGHYVTLEEVRELTEALALELFALTSLSAPEPPVRR